MAEESRSHTIITMCPVHARAVARLHAHCIVTGFLSTLGERFLARLYRAIAEDPDSVVLVALARDKRTERSVCTDSTAVTGFVAGTRSTRGMYRRILHRHWLPFSLLLLPRALSPRVLKYIFETMAYGRRVERERKRTEAATDAELLSIAVDPNARGLGLGRALVEQLELWLDRPLRHTEDRHTEELNTPYKVVTTADDPISNAFYRSCGFALVATFRHHGNEMKEYCKDGTSPVDEWKDRRT